MLVQGKMLEPDLRDHDASGGEPLTDQRSVASPGITDALETADDADVVAGHVNEVFDDLSGIEEVEDLGPVAPVIFLGVDRVEPWTGRQVAIHPIPRRVTSWCAARDADFAVPVWQFTKAGTSLEGECKHPVT